MIDAGMNDLAASCALPGAPPHRAAARAARTAATAVAWRVVGPVCESSDDFGEHLLAARRRRGQVAILDAGAYGYTMASTYNGRQLPAEVFLRDGRVAGRTEQAERRRVGTGPRAHRRLSRGRASRPGRAPRPGATSAAFQPLSAFGVPRPGVRRGGGIDLERRRRDRPRAHDLSVDEDLDADGAAAARESVEVDARQRRGARPAARDR